MEEAAPERDESDEQIVDRFKNGDESAFDALVLRHRNAVYRLAFRLMGTHADADDLAQDAFLRAYLGLRRFRGESLFGTWLTRIVVNLALNARRSQRPVLPLEEAGIGMPQRRDVRNAADVTLEGQVRQAVGLLPARQRQVLTLKIYEGLKFSEIASAAGITVGTAKATFFQAVQGLRKKLAARPEWVRGEKEIER